MPWWVCQLSHLSQDRKKPQALDDLIKETASKMACCPFFVPEPVLVRRQGRETRAWFPNSEQDLSSTKFQNVPCNFHAISSAGRCRRQGCEGFLWTASVSSLHLGTCCATVSQIKKDHEVKGSECRLSPKYGNASQEPSSRQQPGKELKTKLGACSSTLFLHKSTTCPRILTTWLANMLMITEDETISGWAAQRGNVGLGFANLGTSWFARHGLRIRSCWETMNGLELLCELPAMFLRTGPCWPNLQAIW